MREGGLTATVIEIKHIIREFYEQLHANKLERFNEMNKLVERYKLLTLTQEEIQNLKRRSKEIDLVIKEFTRKKT